MAMGILDKGRKGATAGLKAARLNVPWFSEVAGGAERRAEKGTGGEVWLSAVKKEGALEKVESAVLKFDLLTSCGRGTPLGPALAMGSDEKGTGADDWSPGSTKPGASELRLGLAILVGEDVPEASCSVWDGPR